MIISFGAALLTMAAQHVDRRSGLTARERGPSEYPRAHNLFYEAAKRSRARAASGHSRVSVIRHWARATTKQRRREAPALHRSAWGVTMLGLFELPTAKVEDDAETAPFLPLLVPSTSAFCLARLKSRKAPYLYHGTRASELEISFVLWTKDRLRSRRKLETARCTMLCLLEALAHRPPPSLRQPIMSRHLDMQELCSPENMHRWYISHSDCRLL